MNDGDRLAAYVETWKRACDDFVALARTVPDELLDAPTDLAGWSVRDNIAHIAHLEAVLAGAPEETGEPPSAEHVTGPMGRYTEQGVRARDERGATELIDEIERSVASRYAELRKDPPSDPTAAAPRTPGGIGWNNETLLGNRPLDVWMHEQDIRRAIGRPGNLDSPAALHTVRRLGAALPMVLGKRVAPEPGTSVLLQVPEAGYRTGATVGDDGRATPDIPAQPSVGITLGTEAFIVLAGGRRTPDQVSAEISGDKALAHALLAALAVTP